MRVVSVLSFVSYLTASLLLGAGVSCALYEDDGPVAVLTADNFDELVSTSPVAWVVEYFAPWCGHCQALAPQYTKAADNLKGLVNVGAVDCDVEGNKRLCSQAGVQGFPSIKIYPALKSKNPYTHKWEKLATDYQGPRTAKPIVDAALAQLSDSNIAKVSDAAAFTEYEAAAGKAALPQVVLFTNKPKTTALYKSLSLRYKGRAAFAEVQSTASVAEKFGITNFPTLLVVTPSGDQQLYQGNLKPLELISWLDTYVLDKVAEAAEDSSNGGAGAGGSSAKASDALLLPVWGMPELEKHMEEQGMWVLAMVQGVGAPGGCMEAAQHFSKLVVGTKGVLGTAAVVNVSASQAARLQPHVDVTGWSKDPCEVKVVAMPHEEDKASEDWPVFTGDLGSKALQAWYLELVPNHVTRLTADAMDAFLTSIQVDTPKVVLFTDKDETPGMYKALAYGFRDHGFLFGDVHARDKKILQQFNVPKVPFLMVMSFAPQGPEGEDTAGRGFRIQPYNGPMQYIYMTLFLQQQAQMLGVVPEVYAAETAAAGGGGGGAGSVPELTGQEVFEEACTSKLGLCVIAALDPKAGDPEDHAENLQTLQQAQQRMHSEPFQFMWVNSRSRPSFVTSLGGTPAGGPQLTVLSPSKLRFKPLTNTPLVVESVIKALRGVLGGQIGTLPLSELPRMFPEEALELVEEEVEVVEEEFDLDEIMSEALERGAPKTKEQALRDADIAIQLAEEEQKRAAEETAAAKKSKKKKKKKKKGKKSSSRDKDEL